MSSIVPPTEYSREFDLGDRVSFTYLGLTLEGEVVRVYNSRQFYHVEVAGDRYLAHIAYDNMRRLP